MARSMTILRGLSILAKNPPCRNHKSVVRVQMTRYHGDGSSSSMVKSNNLDSRHPVIETDLDPFSRVDETKKTFVNELAPPLKRSYNLAAYTNSSETLQKLIRLGVSLFDIESINPKAAGRLVQLDFAQDCLPYIRFLLDNGLKEKNIGRFISEYPDIFSVPRDDLEVRIKYLRMKRFSKKQISKALNRSCQILSLNVKSLDYKLGEFQIEFGMPATIIREIISSYPPVIALPIGQYKMVHFTLSEEFGFTQEEMHTLLLGQPKILDIPRPLLIERVDLVHNTIGLSHETICKFPKILNAPIMDLRHRFSYLEKLKRNQFDPKEPLYVPPSALYNLDDEKFCEQYAKTSLADYKLFLRHS